MKIGLKHLLVTTALAGTLAPAALAQDNPFIRGRYTAVTERQQPEYDPLPIRAGGFDVTAALGVSAEYNDNVFAQASNEVSDTIVRVQPSVDARSHWSSNELNAGVSLDHREYLNEDSETSTDYNAYVGGRLDMTRNVQFTARATAGHFTEPRYEPASANSPDPAEYDRLGLQVGATLRNDRLQLDVNGGSTQDDFNTFFNYRDMTENFVAARGSYAISPNVSVFVQGRSADQDYDQPAIPATPTTPAVPSRDGTVSSVQVGTNFELAAPFRGEIAIGTNKDDKDDPTLRDLDGLDLQGNVQWFPTQLTTVTFRANRNVFDPGLINSTSATATRYGVRVDHELLRNVVLFGDLGLGKYEFEGIDREDKFTDVSVGASYKLNRHARIEASYSLHNQDSSGAQADRDLDQNIFSIGLRVFP